MLVQWSCLKHWNNFRKLAQSEKGFQQGTRAFQDNFLELEWFEDTHLQSQIYACPRYYTYEVSPLGQKTNKQTI